MSLIYLVKFKKSNFQIVIDSIYDNDWDYKAINYIYGINIYDSVFLNMGLIQNLSNNDLKSSTYSVHCCGSIFGSIFLMTAVQSAL